MKKLLSLLTTIILIWGIFIGIEYYRVYNNGLRPLITINMEVSDSYTKKTCLGYSIKEYNYDVNNIYEEQVIKEFAIFGIIVSREVVVV